MNKELDLIIKKTKESFDGLGKEKILAILTTADITNPPVIGGAVRETETTITGTVLVRNEAAAVEIIKAFDGEADYFLVDSEVKNEFNNLQEIAKENIKKSRVLICKPNDFTVESLDMLVALLFPFLEDRKIFIVGAGNIGAKTALKMCERGGEVYMYDIDKDRLKAVISGLNVIKRSNSSIKEVEGPEMGARDSDLIIGCAPGVPAITKEMVRTMNGKGKVIDAGNRNVEAEAIEAASERGIEVLSLSSLGGYRGMIENFRWQREILENVRERRVGKSRIITPGILGKKGDVLVDKIEEPKRVFGICDGRGGLIKKEEEGEWIKRLLEEADEEIATKLKKIID